MADAMLLLLYVVIVRYSNWTTRAEKQSNTTNVQKASWTLDRFCAMLRSLMACMVMVFMNSSRMEPDDVFSASAPTVELDLYV